MVRVKQLRYVTRHSGYVMRHSVGPCRYPHLYLECPFPTLISTAQAVEDAVQYDLGTWHMEGSGGSHIPLQWFTPVGVWPNIFPRPVQTQLTRPREMVNQGPPYQTQTKSSAPKASEQRSAANPPCPAGARHNPSSAPNQAGPICFRCGKAGHLGRDCKQGKLCAAVA